MSKIIQKFAGDRRGSPALEFALIAPLFFATLFGSFELGRAIYESNRVGAAAALGARSIVLVGDDETAIEDAITDKLDNYDEDDLTIDLSHRIVEGEIFKRIEVSYQHDFLVDLGAHLSSVTISALRYAPAGSCSDAAYVQLNGLLTLCLAGGGSSGGSSVGTTTTGGTGGTTLGGAISTATGAVGETGLGAATGGKPGGGKGKKPKK